MQINLGHVTASFTLDVYGHTENVLAVRGSDYRILFDGEGGGATIPFSPQSSGVYAMKRGSSCKVPCHVNPYI